MSINDDIVKCNETGVFSSINGDVTLENCGGKANTVNGDIDLKDCGMTCVDTVNGDITLNRCSIDILKTVNGNVTLIDSSVLEMHAEDICGKGFIDHLILPQNASCKNVTYKNGSCTITATGSIQIAGNFIHNVVNSFKKEDSNVSKDYIVPKDIRINKITTDRNVISTYDIEVIGGKLIKKVPLI